MYNNFEGLNLSVALRHNAVILVNCFPKLIIKIVIEMGLTIAIGNSVDLLCVGQSVFIKIY